MDLHSAIAMLGEEVFALVRYIGPFPLEEMDNGWSIRQRAEIVIGKGG